MTDFSALMKEYAADTDIGLKRIMSDETVPKHLLEVMEYSLMAGGKRLRPALVLSFAELFGGRREDALPFACAVEMIHTYSLIHDDMPCIDNDDLRRGRPTSHKRFDERRALLAGDALLSYAFEVMLSCRTPGAFNAAAAVAAGAGVHGMVAGQWQDVLSEGKTISDAELDFIHKNKTGAMIICSSLAGAIIAGATQEQLEDVRRYAALIGLTFQISDDILDVTGDAAVLGKNTGMDKNAGKVTYVSQYGLETAIAKEKELTDSAVAIANKYGSDFHAQLARFIVERNK